MNARNAEPLRRYKKKQRGIQIYFTISNLLKTSMIISFKITINYVCCTREELKLIVVETYYEIYNMTLSFYQCAAV